MKIHEKTNHTPHSVIARELRDRGNLLNQRLGLRSSCAYNSSAVLLLAKQRTTKSPSHAKNVLRLHFNQQEPLHSLHGRNRGPTRIHQHKNGTGSKFTSKYKTTILVYAKAFNYVKDALRIRNRRESAG